MLLTPFININLFDWFHAINWHQPSWDLFIILLFLVGVFLYGFSMGRNRLIVILIALYLAKAITDVLPQIPQFNENLWGQYYVIRLIFFGALFLILFFMFISSGPLRTLAQAEGGRWYQVIIFSLLHVGLFITIIFSYLTPEILNNFSQTSRELFNSPLSRFIWVTLPIISLAYLRDAKKRGRPPIE